MSDVHPRTDGTPTSAVNDADPHARSLRGLAHPLRLRILNLLQNRGPATGKAVSEQLGITSASASYHLRQLHAYGFVEEAPELGSPRERWWHAPHRSYRFPEELDTSEPRLSTAVRLALVVGWSEDLYTAAQKWNSQPEAWREAQAMCERRIRLTPDELAEMGEEIRAVIDRYARDVEEDVPGGRVVTTHFAAFPCPCPDDVPPQDPG